MFEGRNVHYSTDNKPLCSFSGKLCKLRRLNGYAFCVRHILEDPSAPYRQCSFVVKSSGQQCSSAIPASQNREYCHSHMQVMGMIPKKERRKKVDLNVAHDLDGSIADKNHVLHNSLYSLHEKPTKLFPELAGKLSTENFLPGPSSNSFINGVEIHNDTAVKGKSPSKISGSTPRRHKKSVRRAMAIIRKKQLGLLSHSEAKSILTPAGCQTYSQYVVNRTYHSDLLTPVIDSSDDDETEDTLSYPPLTYSRMLRKSNLSRHDTPDSPQSCSPASPLILPSTETDLSCVSSPNSQQSSQTEGSVGSVYSDDESICSEVEVADADLICLMKSYVDVMCSSRLNHDSIHYHQSYLSSLLSLLKQSSVVATKLVKVLRLPSYKHEQSDLCCPKPEAVAPPVITNANQKRVCRYVDVNTEKRCNRTTVPFANHCLQHISYNVSQQLFSFCTACDDDNDDVDTGHIYCKRPVIDVGHGPPLCALHTPPAFKPDDLLDVSVEMSEASKKNKKRSKSFALLKHPKKKKKKTTQVSKLGISNTTEAEPLTNPALASPVAHMRSTPEPVICKEEEAAALTAVPAAGLEEEAISPLDKSLELPLDHADSKLLLLDELNLFSADGDDDIGLTDADAQMILSAQSEDSPVLNESCELPDDITDAILHVESEQKALESQKNSRLQTSHQGLHDPVATQNHMINANGPTISSNQNFEHNHSLSHSLPAYSLDNSLNSGLQAYNHPHHQGPPPQYPGATKLMQHSPIANMATPHMPPHINYIHAHPHSQQQANTYNHHQLHQKLQQQPQQPSPVSQHSHIIMNNSPAAPHTGYHIQSLPPSSTLLDPTRHPSAAPVAHMERLPPVSSIAMQQQQWAMEDNNTIYNNGYHTTINDPGLFTMSNGLPSPPPPPPQYPSSRDQRSYHHFSQPYHSNPYHLIPPSPQPQRLNMPLQ